MFRSQRENLFPVSRRSSKKKRLRKTTSPVAVGSSVKTVKTMREMRDDIHQRAFRIKPRY